MITAVLAGMLVILVLMPGAWAQGKYKTLHKFTGVRNGSQPVAGLIFDKAGNLYGTTCCGGHSAHGSGTVFKLTPHSDGKWTESVLYSFSGGSDGGVPLSGVIFDRAGNLYGTTTDGGDSKRGVVYELTPSNNGWTEKVLHSFSGGDSDGSYPTGGLIFDSSGNLYGTANRGGGPRGLGVVFQLTPQSDGTWTENILHEFRSKDGAYPAAGLVFDAAGNLYGTTSNGGTANLGVAFELTPANGQWTISILHNFTGSDGSEPAYGALLLDTAGNLYGATFAGGTHGYGAVFKLAQLQGKWKETVIHGFANRDGAAPTGGLTFDSAGNLYGTASAGGNLNRCSGKGCGVAFKLVPNGNGGWTETKLWVFQNRVASLPNGTMIFDAAGNLYGTTSGDSATTFGTVFEIGP
jgi:uncharacterized repeat protein (TIGR03803 family)